MAPWGLGMVNSPRGHTGAGQGLLLRVGVGPAQMGRSLEGRKWWGEEHLMVVLAPFSRLGQFPPSAGGPHREGAVWPG